MSKIWIFDAPQNLHLNNRRAAAHLFGAAKVLKKIALCIARLI
jgi:hypothetical protein